MFKYITFNGNKHVCKTNSVGSHKENGNVYGNSKHILQQEDSGANSLGIHLFQ